MKNIFKVSIKVEAFGHNWEGTWGNPDKTSKILNAEITVMTIGITIGIFV